MFGAGSMTPEMEQGVAIARKENPNLAPVQPYGFFSRMFSPNALAYASPGKSIYLNPDKSQGQSAEDIADTLTHEQTHVNQMNTRGLGPTGELLHEMFGGQKLPYDQRPDEMAAFQAEKDRRARMGRMQTGVPRFKGEGFYTPQDDIYLRKENGVKTGPSSASLGKMVK